MSNQCRNRSRKGFTLIELLTVIAIIGILAGLTFVAVSAAKRRAYIAKAQSETRELVKAWNVYWMTFGEWPGDWRNRNDVAMDTATMSYLKGNNGMNLTFLDVELSSKGFEDPWGNVYTVDFSRTKTEGSDVYEACVALPLQNRYKYE